MEKEIHNVFKTLTKSLHQWVDDAVEILDNGGNPMTSSRNWDLLNRQIQTKIDEWYLLVDKADVEVKKALNRKGIVAIPPIVENNIRRNCKRGIDILKGECKNLLEKYTTTAPSNTDDEIVDELLRITQGVTMDNLLNIIKQ